MSGARDLAWLLGMAGLGIRSQGTHGHTFIHSVKQWYTNATHRVARSHSRRSLLLAYKCTKCCYDTGGPPVSGHGTIALRGSDDGGWSNALLRCRLRWSFGIENDDLMHVSSSAYIYGP